VLPLTSSTPASLNARTSSGIDKSATSPSIAPLPRGALLVTSQRNDA
jgi:hypothetical protein